MRRGAEGAEEDNFLGGWIFRRPNSKTVTNSTARSFPNVVLRRIRGALHLPAHHRVLECHNDGRVEEQVEGDDGHRRARPPTHQSSICLRLSHHQNTPQRCIAGMEDSVANGSPLRLVDQFEVLRATLGYMMELRGKAKIQLLKAKRARRQSNGVAVFGGGWFFLFEDSLDRHPTAHPWGWRDSILVVGVILDPNDTTHKQNFGTSLRRWEGSPKMSGNTHIPEWGLVGMLGKSPRACVEPPSGPPLAQCPGPELCCGTSPSSGTGRAG